MTETFAKYITTDEDILAPTMGYTEVGRLVFMVIMEASRALCMHPIIDSVYGLVSDSPVV